MSRRRAFSAQGDLQASSRAPFFRMVKTLRLESLRNPRTNISGTVEDIRVRHIKELLHVSDVFERHRAPAPILSVSPGNDGLRFEPRDKANDSCTLRRATVTPIDRQRSGCASEQLHVLKR